VTTDDWSGPLRDQYDRPVLHGDHVAFYARREPPLLADDVLLPNGTRPAAAAQGLRCGGCGEVVDLAEV